MGRERRSLRLFSIVLGLLLFVTYVSASGAQGFPRTAGPLDLAPSSPLGMPGTTAGLPTGSNSLFLSSGMFHDILPPISNLEIGYLYSFGERVRTGRLTLDYLLPVSLGTNGTAFGEAHGEFVNFWNSFRSLIRGGDSTTSQRAFPDRINLSFGGGYRKIFAKSLLVGINGFYDTSKLGVTWYGSGGAGLELAALLPGSDVIDLNYNYYGSIFGSRSSLINAFRNGPGNFDVEVGYSHELGPDGPDLRLKLTGYQFDVGTKVYGWNAGAEATTRNGMFSVKLEAGRDKLNDTYYTIGGYVNVGIRLERLLSGDSPFTMPEPVFHSPRNLRRMLTQKTHRNWHQPSAVVSSRTTQEGPQGLQLFAVRTIPDDCITWPQGGGNPFDNIAAFPFTEGPLSQAEAQSAKKIVISFTVISNTTNAAGQVGLGDSATYTPYVAGSPVFPPGAAAVGSHSFELTPGQFVTDVDLFIIVALAAHPSGTVCYADAVAQFYR